MQRKLVITSFLFLLLFSLPVIAESKYTREKSEELFHLINWQDYTSETFDRALREQKPIYLVISAPAWCYWCHVYESEDYLYNPSLYPYINENFIPVFVDSDKRPDITKKYLEGGWPSTTIFTPNMVRIQGFSGPRDPHGLRTYLESTVNYLRNQSFSQASIQVKYENLTGVVPTEQQLLVQENNYLQYLQESFDQYYGGFGIGNLPQEREGQKFPSPLAYKFLAEKYAQTGNKIYLGYVKTTFDNLYTNLSEINVRYHLYDPVEGGFHRYSTKRDWTSPHYEKMLFDQAKFIFFLTDFYDITKDERVKTALDGTVNFVQSKMYDKEGGFYSSQDAHMEEIYFGELKEERAKLKQPYIDKTRNIDSNSMMIVAFLKLYNRTKDERHREIAKKSLDFLKDNMIGGEGAYYYFDYERKLAFLTGQATSNSWVLLAFVEGYESLGDKNYLSSAEKIAGYSLDNLYDWESGGFFNRNSKDTGYYAPNERVDLSKPYEENAVYSYSMLRLYLVKKDLRYLEAGLKTLGMLLQKSGGLDNTYFTMKASELVKDEKLLAIYQENLPEIDKVVNDNKKIFSLHDLLNPKTNYSLSDVPKLKDEFSNAGFIVLGILAFLAGILSFLSPCCLPVLSAYFASNIKVKKGEVVINTLFFFLGVAIVFSIFGMGATFVGNLFREHRELFTKAAGATIILFGLLEIFGKGFSGLQFNIGLKRKTPLGNIIFGMLFAVGWSACIGPILASLLLLSATSGTILKGMFLLFIYSFGLFVPLLLISLYLDKLKNKKFWNIIKGKSLELNFFGRKTQIHTTYLISGIILIIIGLLIFNDYLYRLNQYALQTTYVQDIILQGEQFIKNIFLR